MSLKFDKWQWETKVTTTQSETKHMGITTTATKVEDTNRVQKFHIFARLNCNTARSPNRGIKKLLKSLKFDLLKAAYTLKKERQ